MAKSIILTKWSPNLAYAVGLLTTDGSLSKDRRHVDFTSKDIEQIQNLKTALNIRSKIGQKKSGSGKISYRVQIGNVVFYNFLISIGLYPNKTKTLGVIKIPNEFFFDFLRGHFDGDGTFYAYKDNRWKNSHMHYMCFCSASKDHIKWIRVKINELLSIKGSLVKAKNNSAYQLKYAKKESSTLISHIYYNNQVICLKRKLNNVTQICAGGEMVYTYA